MISYLELFCQYAKYSISSHFIAIKCHYRINATARLGCYFERHISLVDTTFDDIQLRYAVVIFAIVFV